MYPGAMALTLTPFAAHPFENDLTFPISLLFFQRCKTRLRWTYNTLNTMFSSSISNNIQTTYLSASPPQSMSCGRRRTLISDQTGDIDDLSITPWITSDSAFWYFLSCDSTSRAQHMFTYHQPQSLCQGKNGPTGITSDLEHSIQVDL